MPIYTEASKWRKHKSAGNHTCNFDVTRRGIWTFADFGFVANIMIFRWRSYLLLYLRPVRHRNRPLQRHSLLEMMLLCRRSLNGDSGYMTLMWILDRTSGIREKISKFRHANYIYSPVIHTDVHLQHEWLQAFAWKIAANIHVLVSVNTQAKILHVHSCK